MPIQVLMPQLGESVVEGTLTQWLKSVGERVEQYEPLVEVNTDKVDTELPCPGAGVLAEILVEAGATVHAGTLLAIIHEVETDASVLPEPQAGQNGNALPAPTSKPLLTGRHPKLGFISPLVARLAQEHAIDLSQVTGTGLDGRITKQDVLQHINQAQSASLSKPSQPSPKAVPLPAPPPTTLFPGDELIQLSMLRRKIAEHMVLSERTSPHVTTVMEADLSRVVAHRQANKASFLSNGVNLTYTAYFVSAAASALRAFPLVNASWSDQGVILHRQINIGMATALEEDGLIVPVIHQADALSLLGLARAISDLASRARGRKLLPDEVHGGTFTVTNHGVSGSLFATPIINQPQCAILGAGIIQKRAVVLESEQGDSIAIRPMVYLSLTFDHRILDGAVADHFLGKVVELLQNWND
jgi:2-oxoglutarate dehydrogenase E2 component (dihydrolipoamide succinyltransferase)